MSEALVEAANQAGSPDNVTVVAVRIGAGVSPDDETDRALME
jgi:serine/threonine protein phosphatase PrpC